MNTRGALTKKILHSTKISAAVVAAVASMAVIGAVFLGMILVALLTPAPYPYEEDSGQPKVFLLEDGWQRLVTNELELHLPPRFVVSDPQEVTEAIDAHSANADKKVRGALMWGKLSRFTMAVSAQDPEHSISGFATNVIVMREQVISAIDPERYMNLIVRNFPGDLEVHERDAVRLTHYRARRLLATGNMGFGDVMQLYLFIKVNNTMWSIIFSTTVDEYADRRPALERSGNSFRLIR